MEFSDLPIGARFKLKTPKGYQPTVSKHSNTTYWYGSPVECIDCVLVEPVLDEFTKAYLEAAYFFDKDEDWDGSENFSDDFIARAISDCYDFQATNKDPLGDYAETSTGHDFWLTRNHHGAGFWDGDYPKLDGDALTVAAHKFPQIDLYLGDDGQIYGM